MKTIYLTEKVNNNKKTAVAIGKFDAVHLGHMCLIKKAAEYAKENDLKSIVYTVKIKSDALVSADEAERIRLIGTLGINMICTDEFTDDYSKQSPEEFVKNVLIAKLNASYVTVGYNFKFGYKRIGDASTLKLLCNQYGIECEILDCVCDDKDNIPISTTYIKELIETGEVKKVYDFLGRYFSVTGVVCHGKQLGRKLGFPTLNIQCVQGSLIPKTGVYLTKVQCKFGGFYGITNIGKNPTVSNTDDIKIETHIIDFASDLYGANVTIEFLDRIRDEKEFSSLELLKEQLKRDLNFVRDFIKAN